MNVKERRCAGCPAETVSVYTKLDGTTLAVDGGSEKNQAGCLARAMLSDILALEAGEPDGSLLCGLGGVKSGLYSAAFTEMAGLMESGEGGMVPASARHAMLSLEGDERYLKTARGRMEKEGIYPGSSAYAAIQQACYYVGTWRGQLEKMSCLLRLSEAEPPALRA